MLLAFELSMPNVGSWNGRWTGEDRYYAKVINIGRTKEKIKLGNEILEEESYYHSFGDGWGMNISVRKVNGKEASKIRSKSKGFCGYDWAIESIIKNKKIMTKREEEQLSQL